MKVKSKKYLHNWYNATCTDNKKGDLETYQAWLERQLLSRIEKIEKLEKQAELNSIAYNFRKEERDKAFLEIKKIKI